MGIPRAIRTVLLLGGIGLGLSGCVAYDPYPYGYSYGYGSPYYSSPYYGSYAAAPSLSFGLNLSDGGWHHRRWR